VPGVDSGRQQLFFFPDRILVRQDGQYDVIPYSELRVTRGSSEFREDDRVPSDAKVIGQTWEYVNESGGPDQRFKNNRQIPIALYGQLHLTSTRGVRLFVQVSNKAAADQCYTLLSAALANGPHPDGARAACLAAP